MPSQARAGASRCRRALLDGLRTVRRGFKEANGSWNTICKRDRNGLSSRFVSRVMSEPRSEYARSLAQPGGADTGDRRLARSAFPDEPESLSPPDLKLIPLIAPT